MLHVQVAKAGWLATPQKPQAASAAAASDPKPVRN
jgi:hypothetical protein